MAKTIILLVSGGLDSFIAYHYLKKDGHKIIPLFIDYSGRYTNKEIAVVKKLFPRVLINQSLYLGDFEHGEKAFIKNRNAFFVFTASTYGTNICLGGLKDDNVGDKSPESFIKMGDLLTEMNGENYNVFSPFWQMTKSNIINWYITNKLPMELLLKTTSCYDPVKHFCGECPSCFRKWCAFHDNKIAYLLPPFTKKSLMEEYLKNIKKYNVFRQKSILSACKNMGVI